ncbi:MAG TPA: aminoglycoside phosphotransferase family protein [Planctomycetota bacterium]|nr:aminoglycoside phosphotransferase family protein [Planctomycetota bacterium]
MDIEDPRQLIGWLRATGRIAADEEPRIATLSGGVSNRTVLVERQAEAWVLKQALATLRVATEWHCSPERVHREALGLRWLERLAPAGSITPLLFEDHEHHVLAMRAVPRPHVNLKDALLAGDFDDAHLAALGELLGAIHAASRAVGPAALAEFADRSFFVELRLEPYYRYTAANVAAAGPFLAALERDLDAAPRVLVHGDYSPKNVLVRSGRLVLLDHEVIHLGDGAFDVGFALAHLISKAHHLPALRERFARGARGFWSAYAAASGEVAREAGFAGRAARHGLACLLARVAGRSPIEYLTSAERAAQRRAALALMAAPPDDPAALVDRFLERI